MYFDAPASTWISSPMAILKACCDLDLWPSPKNAMPSPTMSGVEGTKRRRTFPIPLAATRPSTPYKTRSGAFKPLVWLAYSAVRVHGQCGQSAVNTGSGVTELRSAVRLAHPPLPPSYSRSSNDKERMIIKLEKLTSVHDRGQTDRIIALSRPLTLT